MVKPRRRGGCEVNTGCLIEKLISPQLACFCKENNRGFGMRVACWPRSDGALMELERKEQSCSETTPKRAEIILVTWFSMPLQ